MTMDPDADFPPVQGNEELGEEESKICSIFPKVLGKANPES